MAVQPHIIAGISAPVGIVLVALLATGCGNGSNTGHLRARFTIPPSDTTQFTTDARASLCAGGRGIVLEGIAGGSGVLAWLRGGNPPEGSYVPLPRGDTLTRRGAVVSARLGPREPSRGVLLDSGSVVVTSANGRIGAQIEGRGTDLSSAARITIDITFDSIPAPSDTVQCRVAL